MTPAADIKRLFDKGRLIALAEQEGLGARHGRIQCPKRCSDDPRGASVSDSPDGALWRCARCSAGGSAIDLVMAARGIEFVVALEQLSGEPPPAPKLRVVKPPMNGAQLWERLSTTDPAGEAYLRGRGLEAAVPLVRFNTGHTGDSWLDGLASKGYRLAVPLRDAAGVVLDFQVRSVTPGVTGREAKRSLCGERPKGTAFGRPDLARGGGRVFVAEGMADSLALQVAGAVVVGAPGVDQLRHLVKLIPAKSEVVLCPQNDQADQSAKAFGELAKRLRDQKCTIRQLSTPEAWKDPADWLQAGGLEAFKSTIATPPPELPAPPEAQLPIPGTVEAGGPLARTDFGNAERLVRRHGQDLRHSKALGWLVWDGGRWQADDTDQVLRFAKETVRAIYGEAQQAEDSDVRKAIADHARRSESASKLQAMVKLAESEPCIPVRVNALDADPWLLNCANGVVDLRTGTLRTARREDLLTKLAPVVYDPAAPRARWLQFLEETQPDPEVRAFLRRFIGYSLTGVIAEHVFIVNYGSGRNGKGVFTNALLSALGDYARAMPTELLMQKQGDAHPTERSELLGVRLAVAAETEEGKSLNVALVKQLTGGDPISARRMHKDFFQFWPTHKLMLATNHRPRIKETKDAIWDRVRLVPWEQRFPDGDPRQDPNLKHKLAAELPGILAWAVEGCMEWQAQGLNAPLAVRAATEEYRSEEDPIGNFIDECCATGDGQTCMVRELREAYERWCDEQGDKYPLSPRVFNERLESRGMRRKAAWVIGTAAKVWEGISLTMRNH